MAAMVVNSMFEAEFKSEREAAYNKELNSYVSSAVSQGMNATSAEQLAKNYMTSRDNGNNPGTFADYSASKSSGSSNTVNITIGGISTPVNVASQADAANLQSVLTQLANAQGRSI